MSEELNKNQTNQRGGKREGAGRPTGSTKRPQISDFITEEEVEELVETAKTQAETKPELLKFLLEQVFGRASQNLDVTSGGDKLNIEFSPIFKKNDPSNTTQEADRNNTE